MSHQHGRRRTGLHGNIHRTNPILAYRTVPIFEIHALPLGMTQLPERLPMLRPGVANSWQDQNRSVSLHAEPSLVGCAKLLWHARTSVVRTSGTIGERSRRIAERDWRDGRDEVEIQSVHVAPSSHVSRITRQGLWRWQTFQHPARHRGALSELVLLRWAMMSLASATGSVVMGAAC